MFLAEYLEVIIKIMLFFSRFFRETERNFLFGVTSQFVRILTNDVGSGFTSRPVFRDVLAYLYRAEV